MEKKESSLTEAVGRNAEFEELLQKLEKKTNWDGRTLYKYCDFWIPQHYFRPLYYSHKNFRAKDTDFILTSIPKSGTTWLAALTFSILNRNSYTIDQSPLLTTNPHLLVPSLEAMVYRTDDCPNLDGIPSPRLFTTHRCYNLLADSIVESNCRVIYICRNPLDQFISYRFFTFENKLGKDTNPLSIEEAFDEYCNGILPFGPIWDHILGYWNAHLKNPQKVLFLKYDDMKEDIIFHMKKLAEFIGVPFSEEEEKHGVIEEISKLCSFESLSKVEVNKFEIAGAVLTTSSFYRKGVVGDWKNHLAPEMAQRFVKLMESKLEGSGLAFNA